MPESTRPDAAALLAELGYTARFTVYVAAVPGAGKTYRLLGDALSAAKAGRRVAVGWVEAKGRPQLDALLAQLPVIPPKAYAHQDRMIEDFDLEAAIASDYELIVLDELAHTNPQSARHHKRWQDALELRKAGKSVLGALNIFHFDNVAPVAERIIGYPVREIVPASLLLEADQVIALDVAPSILESRLRTGHIVQGEDIQRAQAGLYQTRNLELLRELLLRTVDQLTTPAVAPSKVSTALALVSGDTKFDSFLRRCTAFANALDLALEVAPIDQVDTVSLSRATVNAEALLIEQPQRLERGELRNVRAALVIVPQGAVADRILERPVDRDILIADPQRAPMPRGLLRAAGKTELLADDLMRIGYGDLTIYLGSVAGSGKTYAMLDRAHILLEEGVDVIVGFVETHGRAETQEKVHGLEVIPRLPNGEMDFEAIIARRPQVVCIDELAHTNERNDQFAKRYDDVMAILSTGIDVITTLNVQHLEGVIDSVQRLTGTRVQETLPDAVLELAKEVIFIDVTPEVLRERLRQGKIYPAERVEAALTNFFRSENLAALRELTVRELLYVRSNRRRERPFERIIVGCAPRTREVGLIQRAGRLAARLDVEFHTVCTHRFDETLDESLVHELKRATAELNGVFHEQLSEDAAEGLVRFALPTDVIVVEAPRKRRHIFSGMSFARRLLLNGARELLVFAPRHHEPCEENNEAPR